MSVLKKILGFIIALAVILFLISFFLPSKIHVERSTVIKAKPEVIYNIVNNLKTYDDWMPWNKMDPKMIKNYNAQDTGVGASYSWESEMDEVGKGTLTIVQTRPFDYVKSFMDFREQGTGTSEFILTEAPEGTKVTWGMESEASGNLLNKAIFKYIGLFMDKMVGKQFEEGLENLKKIAESPKPMSKMTDMSKEPEVKIEEKVITPMTVLVIKDLKANTVDEIGQRLGENYAIINEEIKSKKLTQSGMPMAWYKTSEAPFIFDAGIPVNKKPASTNPKISVVDIKAGRAVVGHYFGPYDKMKAGYDALNKWITENQKTVAGMPFEIYITDPSTQPDPYKWQTDIIFPLR